MAHQCSVILDLTFKNQNSKSDFINKYEPIFHSYNSRDEGYSCDNNVRPLFDSHIENETVDNTIRLNGWVKWRLDEEDISIMLKKMLCPAGVDSFVCFYEESGFCEYGEYHYSNKELTHKFIDPDNSIYKEQENIDCFYDILDSMLNQNKCEIVLLKAA